MLYFDSSRISVGKEGPFMRRACALLILFTFILSGCALALTREELRAVYGEIAERVEGIEFYRTEPDVSNTNAPGALTDDAKRLCFDYTNFLRGIVGLEEVSEDALYALEAQDAAYLLSVNDFLTHTPDRPDGMEEDLYLSGAAGAGESNIARFNWKRDRILLDALDWYARDDGEENLDTLSHRRWLLDPCMEKTGFGYSVSTSGMSYTAMYAVDMGRAANWDYVAWPCGTFPAELMRRELAWSVSLNDDVFDLPSSEPLITLERIDTGDTWRFEPYRQAGDGFCCLSTAHCGSGSCLIFRPDIREEYCQNMRFHVTIDGIKGQDGSALTIEYDCDMVSLYRQDVAAVELDILELDMNIGESRRLAAEVIPFYADDTSVSWSSDDEAVATVDETGNVTSVGRGSCHVMVEAKNGTCDTCEVTVG